MDVALVTGGTGFIGSHLVRLLLERCAGKVVVSGSTGAPGSLADLRGHVTIERSDIGLFTDVLRLVEKHRPQTIFHVGAMLGPACDDDPEAGIRANALGTYHVLEAARLFGVRQVVFASSLSVFGGASSTASVVDDDATTRPNAIYSASKLFSENLGLTYRRLYGLDFRGLRLSNVNGPGARTHGYLEYFNKAIEEPAGPIPSTSSRTSGSPSYTSPTLRARSASCRRSRRLRSGPSTTRFWVRGQRRLRKSLSTP